VIGSRAAVAEARRLLGPDALLGRSVHSPAAADAEREGADYILFGRSRRPQATPARPPRRLDELAAVAGAVSIPVIAIGGTDRHRLPECLAAGAGTTQRSGPTRGRLRSSSTAGSSSATSTPHAQIADGSVIEVVRMVGGTTANSSNG